MTLVGEHAAVPGGAPEGAAGRGRAAAERDEASSAGHEAAAPTLACFTTKVCSLCEAGLGSASSATFAWQARGPFGGAEPGGLSEEQLEVMRCGGCPATLARVHLHSWSSEGRLQPRCTTGSFRCCQAAVW